MASETEHEEHVGPNIFLGPSGFVQPTTYIMEQRKMPMWHAGINNDIIDKQTGGVRPKLSTHFNSSQTQKILLVDAINLEHRVSKCGGCHERQVSAR